MTTPRFIRFQGDIIKVNDIQEVVLDRDGDTSITYSTEGHSHCWAGDVRDKLWHLIKLALKTKDVEPQTTSPNLEERVKSIEENRQPSAGCGPDVAKVIGKLADGTPVYEV